MTRAKSAEASKALDEYFEGSGHQEFEYDDPLPDAVWKDLWTHAQGWSCDLIGKRYQKNAHLADKRLQYNQQTHTVFLSMFTSLARNSEAKELRLLRFIFRLCQRIKDLEERPSVYDAGIWSAANVYGRGAGASYGGSFWISQVESNRSKPGTNADWRLAAKRGRNGRDAK